MGGLQSILEIFDRTTGKATGKGNPMSYLTSKETKTAALDAASGDDDDDGAKKKRKKKKKSKMEIDEEDDDE